MMDLYKKDIDRPINGVIKVGQLDDKAVEHELSEYVLTEEVYGYLDKFFDFYKDALTNPSDKIGVWISGFFGSGKSHLLKMLAYLLQNRSVPSGSALDLFLPKVDDPSLRGAIERVAEAPKDVLLFNIDAKAMHTEAGVAEPIVATLQRVFDQHRGYSADSLVAANFERSLDEQGVYDAFKQAYEADTGKAWTDDRKSWAFRRTEVVQALQEAMGIDEAAAQYAVEQAEANHSVSNEGFAKELRAWLDQQGPNHHAVFMIDEIGQYIGTNGKLMLNLQTITEELGTHCAGRAWVMVTSQEDIDAVTQGKLRANDFSKIQGRFKTRISLSSSNTDDVIKLRLLEKRDEVVPYLEALYEQHEQPLKGLIRFSKDTAHMDMHKGADSFVSAYPFVPYQFKLLQNVFNQIRIRGAAGKNLAEGERSMLDAFQTAAQSLKDADLGVLAPFHLFYESVEGFLDGNIKLIIRNAAKNPELNAFDVNLLKTLFMIKYVKEMPGTVENLVTLEIDHLERDRLGLQEQVKASLARLERQTLIQRTGDSYEFLTNEEQDVTREIKAFTVPHGSVESELQTLIWDEIFPSPKLRYDAQHDYAYTRMLDGRVVSQKNDDLTLHIVTPLGGDEYASILDDSAAMMRSGGNTVLVRMPDEGSRDLLDELQLYVKTKLYLNQKLGNASKASLRTILDTHLQQNQERHKRVKSALNDLLGSADVFAYGQRLDGLGSSTKERLTSALKKLVDAVYTNRGYVTHPYANSEAIHTVLQGGIAEVQPDAHGNVPNEHAQTAMRKWLKSRTDAHAVPTLKELVAWFTGKPYGWSPNDVLGVLAELLVQRKAELIRFDAVVDPKEAKLVDALISVQQRDKFKARVPQEIDPDAKASVMKFLYEHLDHPAPSSDEKVLADEIRSRLDTIRETAGKDLAIAQDGGYPYEQRLSDAVDLLQDVLGPRDLANFFTKVHTSFGALAEVASETDRIHKFFSAPHQRQLFEKARRLLRGRAYDLGALRDDDAVAARAALEAIVTSDDPASEIPKAIPLVSTLEHALSTLVESHRQEAEALSQEKVAAVRELAHQAGLPEGDAARVIQPLEQHVARFEDAKAVEAVLAMRAQLDAKVESAKKQIYAYEPPSLPGSDGTEDGPDHGPLERFDPAKAAPKQILVNQEDVDAYLEALRASMAALIAAGKRIHVE
jgi:hypothetical protein